MSSYFDKKLRETRAAEQAFAETADYGTFEKTMEAIEQQVVNDCSVGSLAPDVSGELARQVDLVVLRHAIYNQPLVDQPGGPRTRTGPEPTTPNQHADHVAALVDELHSVYHTISRMCGAGRDQPDAYYRQFLARAEERREQMVASTAPEILAGELQKIPRG